MAQSGDIVFQLCHTHVFSEDREDIKELGIYSTREKAEQALRRASQLPGFRDSPERLEIVEAEIDEDRWTTGFVTYTYPAP